MKVQFWKKFSFWLKIKAIVLLFGVGGEVWMHYEELGAGWKVFGIIATVVGLIITNFFEDKNNNDIIDILENKNKD